MKGLKKDDLVQTLRLNPVFSLLLALWFINIVLVIGIERFFLNSETRVFDIKPFFIALTILSFVLGLLSLRIKEPNIKSTPIFKMLVLCGLFLITSCIVFNSSILPSASEGDPILSSVHEAGHAVITEYVNPGTVISIRIIDPWRKRWFTLFNNQTAAYVYRKLPSTTTLTTLNNEICIGLGGLAAVEILMPEDKYFGASSDLEKVEKIVVTLVNNGMVDNRGITWNLLNQEERAKIAHDIVTPQYERAKKIIKENEKAVKILAETLRQNKFMTGNEVRQLLSEYLADDNSPE